MAIELPITILLERPMERPDSPYGQCGQCHYVGIDVHLGTSCPKCGRSQADGCGIWPSPEFAEMWDDVVFAWNQERAELSAVTCAAYFEASVFNLIHWGTCWLDPELNWIGAAFEEIRDKTDRIWRYLLSIKTPKATDQALARLFHADGRAMLRQVLAEDATEFWNNYRRLADFRNQIVHKGKRVLYRTIDVSQDRSEADKILSASIHWIPTCWVVFSRLWNEYIHRPMRERSSG